MAITIPEAPKIIGGEAVTRSAHGVNGAVNIPNIKFDNRAATQAVQDIGTLITNVEKMREDTLMADAQSWWIQNMDNKENEVTSNIKGKNAMNLFATQIKPYADKLEKDLFGEPKDDDTVRIANPALQQKFKEWTNKQLVQYNARIGDYEGKELTKYNESTFDAREAQITEMLRKATTVPEIIGGSESFLELQSVRFQGMNPDYIKQLAASKTDAAVVENIKAQLKIDVNAGRNFLLRNPEVQNVLSDSSKAALNEKIKEEWVAQAITAGGEGIAAGDDGAALQRWTDPTMLAQVFGTTDSASLSAVQKKIYSGAKERSDALNEKSKGIADMMRGQQAGQIAQAKNDEELFNALSNIALSDSKWAYAVDSGRQKDLALANRISALKNTGVEGLQKRSRLLDIQDRMGAGSLKDVVQKNIEKPTFGFDSDLTASDFVEASYTEVAPLTQQEQQLVEEKNNIQKELKQQSEVYADLLNDVVSGVYVGGYDPRLDKLGGNYQKAIHQAVSSQQQYRNVMNRYPEIPNMMGKIDKSFDNSAMARAQTIMAEIVNQADSNGANKLDATRLQQLANYAITQSRDPVSNALESAITDTYDAAENAGANDYWTSEGRVDAAAYAKKEQAIREAGITAFTSNEALKETKTSDKTYEKQTTRAGKVIDKLRNKLPEGLRSVVDDNKDLFVQWYKVGNTSAILNYIRNWSAITQPMGE